MAVESLVHAHVASSTPGRLRLRIRRQDRHAMERVRDHLERQPGIAQVIQDTSTGSLLIHYDHRRHTPEGLRQTLRDVGVVLVDVASAITSDVPDIDGHSHTARQVSGALNRLNRRVSAATGQSVDLKLLVPLTLGGIGVWQTLTRGLGISQVPGYILLWYAFDSYWKFHHEPVRDSRRHRDDERMRGSNEEQ
jgi:Heavy metal associated domain 2